jgi:ATP-binding cassette subfamily F protein uup
MKLIVGAIEPDAGYIEIGDTIQIGYFAQEAEEMNPNQRAIDYIKDVADYVPTKDGKITASQLLERFLFDGNLQYTPIGKLSGGEKRRLYLLTILMQQPNLLILDEPTNDLDIVTLNILEEYLKEFNGSLIIVSHDRHFLDKLVDHLFIFCGDGLVKDFVGSYSEYREFIKDYEAEQRSIARAAEKAEKEKAEKDASKTTQDAPAKKKKLSFKEQRELEQIEKDLERLNAEKAELETMLGSGELPYEKLQSTSERIGTIMEEIDEKEFRWLELTDGL